jgi:hypothetical protein
MAAFGLYWLDYWLWDFMFGLFRYSVCDVYVQHPIGILYVMN